MSLPYEFTAEEIIAQGRTKPEYIKAIKTWLRESGSDFIPKHICDELIVIFLLSCDNDIECVKTTMEVHYRLKANAPEIFDNRNVDDEDIKLVFDVWTISSIPYRTENNIAIHYYKLTDSDYRKMDIINYIKVDLMLLDITQRRDPPNGFKMIIDLENVRLSHLTKFKLDVSQKALAYIQNGLPIKLEAIHIINSKYFIVKLFNFLKTWIKSDLFEKIHFHPKNVPLEQLYDIIAPKEGLPADFGGDLPSLKVLKQHTKKQFQQRQTFWDEEERMRKECPYYTKNNVE